VQLWRQHNVSAGRLDVTRWIGVGRQYCFLWLYWLSAWGLGCQECSCILDTSSRIVNSVSKTPVPAHVAGSDHSSTKTLALRIALAVTCCTPALLQMGCRWLLQLRTMAGCHGSTSALLR
jgi:hypothetical protein